jgi:hypothetical protein
MVGPRTGFVRTTKVVGGLTCLASLGRPRGAVALCGAYCRIEGRRVAVSGALSDPPASPVPGAESLHDASVFRNTFRARLEGVARLIHLTDE